ncbi:MAG: hypothetical protein OEY56_11505, partial [Cyclobacteriaceae bacterium]|nr:hypothetical protein [Cyclobacteriaceae bacterium]
MMENSQLLAPEETIQAEINSWLENSLPASTPWRKQQLGIFLNQGFPTRKNEEYKYTGIDAFIKRNITSVAIPPTTLAPAEVEKSFVKETGHHLVFVNGRYEQSLSSLSNDDALALKEVEDHELLNQVADPTDPLIALNSAAHPNALFLEVAKNKKALPVFAYHFLSNGAEYLISPRMIVHAHEGASLDVVHRTICQNSQNVLINGVTEITVHPNASVNFSRLQHYNDQVFEV